MDPFSVLMTAIMFGALFVIGTPFMMMFSASFRSVVKSFKKTGRTIRS